MIKTVVSNFNNITVYRTRVLYTVLPVRDDGLAVRRVFARINCLHCIWTQRQAHSNSRTTSLLAAYSFK